MTRTIITAIATLSIGLFIGWHVNKYDRCMSDLAAYNAPILGTDD